MSTAAVRKREQAELAAARLSVLPTVLGVCLFGSVARGTATEGSDIDLLVLTTDDVTGLTELYAALSEDLVRAGVSISGHRQSDLAEALDRTTRFAAHLRLEGRVLYDPTGRMTTVVATRRPLDVSRELDRQRRALRRLAHPERFNGRFLLPLSRLYRIGRVVTFARLVERDIIEFDRHRAFARLREADTRLASPIDVAAALAPFHARTRDRRATGGLPFDPYGPHAPLRFQEALHAVQVLAGEEAP